MLPYLQPYSPPPWIQISLTATVEHPPERLGARLMSSAAPWAPTRWCASDTKSYQQYGVHAGSAEGQCRPRATLGLAWPHARIPACPYRGGADGCSPPGA